MFAPLSVTRRLLCLSSQLVEPWSLLDVSVAALDHLSSAVGEPVCLSLPHNPGFQPKLQIAEEIPTAQQDNDLE